MPREKQISFTEVIELKERKKVLSQALYEIRSAILTFENPKNASAMDLLEKLTEINNEADRQFEEYLDKTGQRH